MKILFGKLQIPKVFGKTTPATFEIAYKRNGQECPKVPRRDLFESEEKERSTLAKTKSQITTVRRRCVSNVIKNSRHWKKEKNYPKRGISRNFVG